MSGKRIARGWLLGSLLLGAALPAQSAPKAFTAKVAAVHDGGVLELADGRRVGLQGVTLPSPVVRGAGFAGQLTAALREALQGTGGQVHLTPDPGAQPGVDLLAVARLRRDGESLNELVLRQGLALFTCRTPVVAELDRLFAAAMVAQTGSRGWFALGGPRMPGALPYLNGAVVGLHHQGEKWDYHRQIDELHDAGFVHLSLLFSVFVEKVDGVEIRRDHPRTVTDRRLIETVAYAKKKGMTVLLLPILLILEPGEDDWRGVLRPKDEALFWQSYDRYIGHYADIAERTGADALTIGSEFGSLEDRTETWLRLIKNLRGRYRGRLTYSVNWDHADTARFFDKLDFVGMTAYFSLTDKKDPTVSELVREWRRVARDVKKSHAWHGRPVVFTELGYASQNGINRDPWNYTMAEDDLDLQEQVDCFEAFLRVAPEMKFLRGAYFYDYYEMGGAADTTYSPRGKPAMELWKRWARDGIGGGGR